MGGFLSDVLGTNSDVQTSSQNPYQALAPWQTAAQGLNTQLAVEGAGGGPNPAQQQFLQNSQNIAQQQANVYSQNRALNPGLAARMAGNQAGNLQQNAASTAGIQQAQQQLAAQQLQGGLIHGQEQALNQAGAINAGVASGNQQAAEGIVGGLFNGAGAFMGKPPTSMADGGLVGADNDISQLYSMSRGNPGAQQMQSGIGNFGSGLGDMLHKAPEQPSMGVQSLNAVGGGQGGMTAMPYAKGGPVLPPHLHGMASIYHSNPKLNQVPMQDRFSAGGRVPVMLSPGEKYIPPSETKKVASGQESSSKAGKTIPGKAQVSGDSTKNDTVPMNAEEGGIVIPRSKMGSEEEAQKFVAQEMAKHMKTPEGEFHAALKRAVSGRKRK